MKLGPVHVFDAKTDATVGSNVPQLDSLPWVSAASQKAFFVFVHVNLDAPGVAHGGVEVSITTELGEYLYRTNQMFPTPPEEAKKTGKPQEALLFHVVVKFPAPGKYVIRARTAKDSGTPEATHTLRLL